MLVASSRANQHIRRKHWSVGNLATYEVAGKKLLYGRIGIRTVKSSETYLDDRLEFNPIDSTETRSVSFVFEPAHEFMAIESSPHIDAERARKNLCRLFNSVPPQQRENFRLFLPPVEDFETALEKLKVLQSISKFNADLHRPNPDTEDAWEEFYDNIHKGSGADREKVAWESDTGKLNPDLSTPIGKAIQMCSAAYGTWKAVGRNVHRRLVKVRSGQNLVNHRIDITSVQRIVDSAAHYFQQLFERTANPEKRTTDGTTFESAIGEDE